jgi:hypothetical protein
MRSASSKDSRPQLSRRWARAPSLRKWTQMRSKDNRQQLKLRKAMGSTSAKMDQGC